MLYNATNASNLPELVQYVAQTVPFYGFGALIVIAVVSFISLKEFETTKAFSASMFITFISSVAFYGAQLVNVSAVYVSVVLLAVSIIFLYLGQNN